MSHPRVSLNGLSRNWVIILLGLLVTLHFSVLSSLVEFGYASPDADGYFTQARLIAEEGKFGFEADSPVQYFAAHWIEIEEGKFMSRYPYGFPLLLAMVWKLFGVHAAFFVNPLLATATVWMVYLLSRKFVSKPLSLVIACLVAINPTFNSFTLMYFSHTATVLTLVLGMYLFVLWVEKGHWWLGFLAGLILGSLPSIRYAEVSAGLGIGVFLIGTMILRPERRRSGLLVGLGAFVPVVTLLIFNHVNFGSALKTAYSLTGEQSLSLGYLPKNWAKYFEGLMTKGVGLFFVPGLLGLTAMTINPKQRLAGLSFLMTSLSAVLVYSCYYFGSAGGVGGGGNVRFLIPIFPLVWIGAGYFLENIRSEKLVWIGTTVLIVLQASFWIPDTVMSLAMGNEGAKRSEELIEWLDENVPEGNLIVAERQVHEQIHFTGNWQLADQNTVIKSGPRRGSPRADRMMAHRGGNPAGNENRAQRVRNVMGMRRAMPSDPGGPNPMQQSKGKQLRSAYIGLSEVEHAQLSWEDLSDWSGEAHSIYWLGNADEASDYLHDVGVTDEVEIISTFEVPEGLGRVRRTSQRNLSTRISPPGGLGNPVALFAMRAGDSYSLILLKSAESKP